MLTEVCGIGRECWRPGQNSADRIKLRTEGLAQALCPAHLPWLSHKINKPVTQDQMVTFSNRGIEDGFDRDTSIHTEHFLDTHKIWRGGLGVPGLRAGHRLVAESAIPPSLARTNIQGCNMTFTGWRARACPAQPALPVLVWSSRS